MPVIEILNPQTSIPDVKSKFTIINRREESIDLNEDSWATEYFVLFFHTGPQDPVATSILRSVDKKNDTGPDQLTCKVVGISMDTTPAILDWLNLNPDLKDFDVPLMSDKTADIARQFGVLQQSLGQEQTGAGFPANSVFIIDSMDRVRYHCVLDSRVAFNVGEVARLVRAFQASDEIKGLAMANFKEREDIITNKIPHIKHFYGSKFGGEKHTCEDCPKEVTEDVTDGEPDKKSENDGAAASASSGGDGRKISVAKEAAAIKDVTTKAETDEDKKQEPGFCLACCRR
eukprot:TRINITY_DN5897_c0_g1_i1.p1 TRINITY_DN5897_c0_g1~~TRINITY_DN5897_c0_g1_i1.p1  ORF type:complete len:288 (-),score=126.14 TRINITY_DN5897_c0_g1_i1:65-928(-)